MEIEPTLILLCFISVILFFVNYRPNFITLYISLVDSVGHEAGPDSSEVDSALVEAYRIVGILMNGLKLRNLENCVNLIVLADHG